MSLSLYDLFVTMGPFAKFIVVVLAVMSVISWANAVQKLVQIVRSEPDADIRSRVLALPPGGAARRRDQAGREAEA